MYRTILALLLGAFCFACNPSQTKTEQKADSAYTPSQEEEVFLADLKKKSFLFFWETVDRSTWQSDDRYPNRTFSSIASTGFALPAYIIGIENEYITREEGAERVWNVLNWLKNAPKGDAESGVAGYKGFYYHFLNNGSGDRFKDVELSTIDTALLFGGVLASMEYFDGDSAQEQEIRLMADELYKAIEWDWAMNGQKSMSMGWKPESGFLDAKWTGYNEAMLLMALAMGSPTHPIADDSWDVWTETYDWKEFMGYEHINFGPLFGHQYSQMFIDFRGIQDAYTKEKGIDYFENSRLASLSNREYAIQNPSGFVNYSGDMWGLTACDGPANEKKELNGKDVQFHTYIARGVADGYIVDDGTIAPTAAGGSIPFTPEFSIPTLLNMKKTYGDKVYKEYGFIDAFNMSWSEEGWFAPDYLGIDQGAIIIQLENYQTGLIWKLISKNRYIREGLEKAGFQGGWLAQ